MDGQGDPNANDFRGWAEWIGELVELGQRGAGLFAEVQTDWEQLSQRETPWTTDTVMNEVVNSWERWTPFLGDVIQHGVHGTSHAMRDYWPDAPIDTAAWRSMISESPIGDVSAKYAEVTAEVTERMVKGDYDSADAVETLANLGGMFAQDTWAGIARARASDPDGDTDTTDPVDEDNA